MTLLIADAASKFQTANAIRTGGLVLALVLLGVLGLSWLYNSLYGLRKQRALGAIRLRLPVASAGSAREMKLSRKYLIVGFFALLGVANLVLAYLDVQNADADGTQPDRLLAEPERLVYPFLFFGMGCNLAQAYGRRDRQRWLGVLSGLSFGCLGCAQFAWAVSDRGQEWNTGNPAVESLFGYAMAAGVLVAGVYIVFCTLTSRTLVAEGGICFGSRVVPWSDLKRYEWHDDGDDFVVVLTIPGRSLSRRDVDLMIPVPAEHRNPLEDMLPDTTDSATTAD
ncbi:MAG: hypothetical protein CMJ78_22970 [Planctomycetaceae bacterium]|nr:hypothetical protein [Planctomycetaceae bacterium]